MVFAVFDFDRFTRNDEIGEVRGGGVKCSVSMCDLLLLVGQFKVKHMKVLVSLCRIWQADALLMCVLTQVRIRMCNIDLAYGEEDWQEILPVQGSGQVTI